MTTVPTLPKVRTEPSTVPGPLTTTKRIPSPDEAVARKSSVACDAETVPSGGKSMLWFFFVTSKVNTISSAGR